MGDRQRVNQRDWRTRLPEWAALIGICMAFALANGLAYGVSNHYQYLLHGLHAVNSTFLAGDWFTCSTVPHHTAFIPLMVLFGLIGPMPLMFALANAVAASIVIFCLHALAERWFERPLVVTALAAFLIVVIPRPYVGMTTLISLIFQPSTIGAVGLLAGLTLLCLGRVRNAGVMLAVAALFHINYMVWAVLITGAVVLLNYRQLKARGALWLLTPLAMAVLWHTPFIADSRTADQIAAANAAKWILHDLYMPYHSRPNTWGIDSFVQFAVLMLTGGIAIALAPPRGVSRLAKSIAGILAAIVSVGMLLTTIWQIDLVALLLPYRLAPYLITAALLMIAGATVRATLTSDLSPRAAGMLLASSVAMLMATHVRQYGLVTWVSIVAIAWASRLSKADGTRWAWWIAIQAAAIALLFKLGVGHVQLVLVVLATAVAIAWSGRGLRMSRSWQETWMRIRPAAFATMCILLAMGFVLRVGIHRKDRLGPAPSVQDQALYAWCRSTPVGTQFIVPPDLAGFRLNAGRGVVIDWKCMPILPADTLKWYQRLVDEAGVRFTSMGQCLAGYRSLNADRAEALAARYRADYVVTRPDVHIGSLDAFPVAFSSPAWRVYRITRDKPELLASDSVRDR